MIQKHIDKENPRGNDLDHAHTDKTDSSFVLNRTPIEVTPVKRLPFGNLAENTPTSVTSSHLVLSGGKDGKEKDNTCKDTHTHGGGGRTTNSNTSCTRGSIFSGAVRVPVSVSVAKKEKSYSRTPTTTTTNITSTTTTTPTTTTPTTHPQPTPPRANGGHSHTGSGNNSSGSGNGGNVPNSGVVKKSNSGLKSKHGYMQTTEAYR